MTVRVASCHCGALEVSCDGGPTRVSMCHCIQCQRRTGSAFSVAVFYARAAVRVTGETRTFSRRLRQRLSGDVPLLPELWVERLLGAARLPERIGVALGAFADPDFPPPEQSVWTKDKQRWIALPADLTAYDAAPPQRG